MATLTFLGAARTVTGSKYLLDAGAHRLLVDCGLFQGLKDLRLRNWAALPLHPAALHAVVLTHAHIDHSGWLPRLVAGGFRGPIHCTPATADLCRLVLPDAGRLQEEDARGANRGRYSRHTPALPLFTEADALNTLTRLQPVGFGRRTPVAPGLEAEFINAGHLLGSAFVRMRRAGSAEPCVLFGGDLGRYNRPVLPDPSPAPAADVLLLESTYGDRVHPRGDEHARLIDIVTKAHASKGKVIIPAFAIGRVEEVLYVLRVLERDGKIPPLPVYVDSPMATAALDYYRRHAFELDRDARPEHGEVSAFATSRFQPVTSARESRDIVGLPGPAIVISSSGMATGGRVLNHLEVALPDSRNTVMFVGFQAAGTRGRKLVDGVKVVTIHGRDVAVNARVERLDSMSAHADADEILRWLRTCPRAPAMTYLVHGEPVAQDALKARISRELGWTVHAPAHGERVDLPL
ncbi:MAG: MBL fold metallo-hydrolase [Acidobacteria bacterium]|nr:MBL fold metallo-hydrolase [Acidobacteriota bacterium]